MRWKIRVEQRDYEDELMFVARVRDHGDCRLFHGEYRYPMSHTTAAAAIQCGRQILAGRKGRL